MQLNPARGRKQELRAHAYYYKQLLVYAAQPREGTETRDINRPPSFVNVIQVYAAQPREGTETTFQHVRCSRGIYTWFMQLNPARGRKLPCGQVRHAQHPSAGLCSSTPRGDGNTVKPTAVPTTISSRFMQLNPARGRKLACLLQLHLPSSLSVYAAQPREGTETIERISKLFRHRICWFMQLNPARGRKQYHRKPTDHQHILHGLCSSTPRGDGNKRRRGWSHEAGHEVYAAQPREGTETDGSPVGGAYASCGGLCSSTPRGDGNSHKMCMWRGDMARWFMQLNPARGRKLERLDIEHLIPHLICGLCSSTPRGDGNGLMIGG